MTGNTKSKRDDGFLRPGVVAGIVGVFLIILLLVAWIGGSFHRAEAGTWLCQYGGGFEDKDLKNTVGPGKSGGFAMWDTDVSIPAGDRIYAIDNDPNTADFGGAPIIVAAQGANQTLELDEDGNVIETEGNSADGIVQVTVPVQARFTFNERACEFYNNYMKGRGDPDWNGTRTKTVDGREVKDPGQWPTLLNLQMNQVLGDSIRIKLTGKNWVELYTNFNNREELQRSVAEQLTAKLKASLGDEYFCGPSYKFDGNADGNLEGGCPPIEITIKTITPVDPSFIDNLTQRQKNNEQIPLIESNQALAIKQKDSETAIAINNSEEQQKLREAEIKSEEAIQLAETAKQSETQQAEVAKNQLIENATTQLNQTKATNSKILTEAEAEFCRQLQTMGVDCAEYYKAQNWNPSIILGGSSDPNLLLNVPAG